MDILLIGANGQVGWQVARHAAGHRLLALGHGDLDITNAWTVQRLLADSGAEVVINAAAYTAVDRAEQQPEQAFAVNRDGPAYLAASCARLGIPLLHISTDYIFDGSKRGPYEENDPAAPLGIYGLSKWEGEQAVRQVLSTHVILRVCWVFGEHGHNFVKTMLRLAREREQLRVVADQYGCPTYAGHIAEVLVKLAERMAPGLQKDKDEGLWGTYHYCDAPATNWHGFARTIMDLARAREPLKVREVIPITTAEYPTPAARPANSVLDCRRIRERFGIEPQAWSEGLAAMLR